MFAGSEESIRDLDTCRTHLLMELAYPLATEASPLLRQIRVHVIVRRDYRTVRDGRPWHLRGADVFTVRDGEVAAKLSYVKG